MFRRYPLLSTIVLAIIALPLSVGLWAGWVNCSDNFHVVQPGKLYRSGQLSSKGLGDAIRQHGIKTVINLRGAHAGAAWYEAEAAVTQQLGARHVDLQLSATHIPSLRTVQQLRQLLRTSATPILIHCYGGADRSGLAAAIYESAVAAKPFAEASAQLSLYYGHFPWLWSRSGAMDQAFQKYAGLDGNALVANR